MGRALRRSAGQRGGGEQPPYSTSAQPECKPSDLRCPHESALLRARPLTFQAQCFGDVDAADGFRAIEVGDGAGDFQRAVIGAG